MLSKAARNIIAQSKKGSVMTLSEGKKRKVRVGRGLGVGDLVEKNESQKA